MSSDAAAVGLLSCQGQPCLSINQTYWVAMLIHGPLSRLPQRSIKLADRYSNGARNTVIGTPRLKHWGAGLQAT